MNQQNPGSRQGGRTGVFTPMRASQVRPMSPINRANFGATTNTLRRTFTRLITPNQEAQPDDHFKKIEREINKLIEDSAIASVRGAYSEALEKSKEAANKEKQLRKWREPITGRELINHELTYCVTFNLANQYQNNGMFSEAINVYTSIVKNNRYAHGGRLRVNIGNIYFKQKNYPIAIKMYRMALDLIPKSSKEMRAKIMKNIAIAFVKLGNFRDATEAYESIFEESPDFSTAFNLLLCLYAIGDKARLKRYFILMLSIELPGLTEELDQDLIMSDRLDEDLKDKKRQAMKYIVDIAKLMAPVIEDDIIAGYEWLVNAIKASSYNASHSEIELCKSVAYLREKDLEKAIEVLKGFENKDKIIMAKAATSISFLYFIEGDHKNAEKYAEIAVKHDRFNAQALVNRGNCFFVRNEFIRAKEQYLEAIGVQADCVEALYNLAFVNKKLNMFNEALQALEKLQTITSSSPEVLYQIATLNELLGNYKGALRWYQILLTKLAGPTDPNILARMGAICDKEEDDYQALHYYLESYKNYPANMDTISWLGVYYVRNELYEKASHFFERASEIQPKELKWKLMVASCHRRIGSAHKALSIYEQIHTEHPNSLECLTFLVQLSKELGLPFEEYASNLRRLGRELEAERSRYSYQQELANNESLQAAQMEDSDREDERINMNVTSRQRESMKKSLQKKRKKIIYEDEWANQELGDDMLPS